MMRLYCLFAVWGCICLSLHGQSDPYYDMSIKIDSLIKIGLDSQAYPGAQVLVRHRDSVIYHNSWGYHTYDEQRDVQIDDIYDLASITKVSTGLPILMKLYGEGKLNLDAPITELVPGINRSDKKYITLRAALAHQSRLIPYIVYWLDTVDDEGKLKKKYYRTTPSKRFSIKITDKIYLKKNFYKKIKKAIKKSEMRDVKQYEYSGLVFLLMSYTTIRSQESVKIAYYLLSTIAAGEDNLYMARYMTKPLPC